MHLLGEVGKGASVKKFQHKGYLPTVWDAVGPQELYKGGMSDIAEPPDVIQYLLALLLQAQEDMIPVLRLHNVLLWVCIR